MTTYVIFPLSTDTDDPETAVRLASTSLLNDMLSQAPVKFIIVDRDMTPLADGHVTLKPEDIECQLH